MSPPERPNGVICSTPRRTWEKHPLQPLKPQATSASPGCWPAGCRGDPGSASGGDRPRGNSPQSRAQSLLCTCGHCHPSACPASAPAEVPKGLGAGAASAEEAVTRRESGAGGPCTPQRVPPLLRPLTREE